ncbi:LamG domain-containing protein [Dyadobacter chenhuakuii]|uniref:LamG domain-containing protein n=1 Tax=Dyadobacter chenhuakuii TaxID=2909339 RepID=A0A9X1QDL8_9BACT|nr:LamG domain-containing protein [Dyadobacter chenhuakuii]MCF2498408.1 LamG domain-containing protein [Dyadobacter chenhuakuii]
MANPVLDIPFDEPDGSMIAYDYGPGGHHASIEAGRFVPGKFGNCVYFPAEGKAEIIGPIIDFSQDFSFTVWAKAEPQAKGPNRTWAVFKFPGKTNFVEIELFTRLQYWQNLAVTQAGDKVTVYVDGLQKGTFTRSGNMTGFAIINDAPHKTVGYCSLDGAKSYEQALTQEDINDHIQHTLEPVQFHINNINFQSLGIIVEHLDGILQMPDRKDPLTVDWEDYHGEVVDLMKPVFGVREIELRCWMKAASQDELVSKWLQLRQIFESPGTQRLQIDAGTKPLLFDVYHKERLEPSNKWRNVGPYFARFTLKLREPEPVKRVLKVSGSSVSITLTSRKLLSISWGDGQRTMNVYGNGVTVSHSYGGSVDRYVVISGNIEDITGFSTDAVIVWNKI